MLVTLSGGFAPFIGIVVQKLIILAGCSPYPLITIDSLHRSLGSTLSCTKPITSK